MRKQDVLRRPLLTEKITELREVSNTVAFEVDPRANRVEVRKAVERIFNVRVQSVQTMNVKGKFKRRGPIIGRRKDWKKAIVKLMPGYRIKFFEGV